MKVGDLVRIGSGTARIMADSKESCSGMIIEIDSDNWAQILSTKPRMADPDGYPCWPGSRSVRRPALIFWTPIIMCEVISESR